MLLTTLECEYPRVIRLSPKNDLLAVGNDEGQILVFNFPEGKLHSSFNAHRGEILDINFSRDGSHLVSCSDGNNDVKLWQIRNYEISFLVGRGFNHITDKLSFTPDNKYVVGTSKYYLRIYDLKNLLQIGKFNLFEDSYIETLCFSPYGFYLASGSRENNIKIWDYPSKDFVRSLEGHTERIFTIAFSPDEKYLISGSSDNTIKIWDFPSGTLRKTLTDHKSYVDCVVVSHDGNYLVTTDPDRINIWNFPQSNLLHSMLLGSNQILISSDDKYMITCDYRTGIKVYDFQKIIFD